ncbi:MAG TPA: cation:proton antiporter [Gaiellaceae bacterium]|nr:cation:proton antiporter [Gaiellaceae bacterium]
MTEIADFGLIVLAVSAAVFVALAGMRLADRFSLPYAAVILVGAVVIAESVDSLGDVISIREVERITVVALVVILFDGGLHIGLRRFRRSAGPILALGVFGTFATAGLVAVAAHYLLGLDWIFAGLVGAAIAPTDPAVTFSVFGSREIRGRAGTILEGEAGMNDPVGIALMIGMIELATEDDANFSIVVSEFAIEMTLGLLVGIGGALALLPIMRRVRLTGPALYPIRVLAGAGIIYGLASIVGGSGFLAVFVAGILMGDAAAPRKGEIEGFLSSLAGLAEIAAFVALGLTVGLGDIESGRTWVDGIVLALVLAFVARPLAIIPLLLPARLTWGERVFIGWAGLKGAVPILLGALALLSGVEDGGDLYGIIFIVVLFSVVVQGASVPIVARRLKLPFRRVDHDLAEVLEFVVRDDAFASGRKIGDLPLGERASLGVLIRDGTPQTISGSVVLRPGDRVHVYCQPDDAAALERIFAGST